MEARPFRCCQLDTNRWLLKLHGIMAWLGLFIFMRKGESEVFGGDLSVRFAVERRHQAEILHVAYTRSAQVRMAESENRGIFEVIAGTVVPVAVAGVRPKLHGSKWNGGSGKAMRIAACSNSQIDISTWIFARLPRDGSDSRLGLQGTCCRNTAKECSSEYECNAISPLQRLTRGTPRGTLTR